jgi:glycosyltransferase involved in cell wall biosynthesis
MKPVSDTLEVSVAISTRGRWEMLRTTLGGALGQQGVEHEVIVVDDGSRDETQARLAELAHPSLRVVRHETSAGPPAARNRGLAEARGEWIAFLDDDDLWSPAKLRAQIDVATREGADFVYAGVLDLNEQGSVIEVEPAPRPDELREQLLVKNAIPATCSNLVVRADVLRRLGGFDESFFLFDDWDLGLRLAEACKGAACPESLVGYVKHSRSMLSLHAHDPVEELDRLISKHAVNGEQSLGANVDRAAMLNWVAFTHRRAGRRASAARAYVRKAIESRDLASARTALVVLLDPFAVSRSRQVPAITAADSSWLEAYRDAFPIQHRRDSPTDRQALRV